MKIRQGYFGTKEHMGIAVLGAGMSGINFFKLAEEKLENVEIVCYEKNYDIWGRGRALGPTTRANGLDDHPHIVIDGGRILNR